MASAAVIWEEADGWHYRIARNLREAVQLEALLTPRQRLNSFSCAADSERSLRLNYWQMGLADLRVLRAALKSEAG